MPKMKEIKCPLCGKKLCIANGDIDIKCYRSNCGAIVRYRADTDTLTAVKEPERTTNSGKRFY